jgi:hypothetical protein
MLMATKISKPNNSGEVLKVMQSYAAKKGFNVTKATLEYLAEDCYLHFESRGWPGIKYWPPVAQRWLLNYVHSFGKEIKPKPKKKTGPTVRERLLG